MRDTRHLRWIHDLRRSWRGKQIPRAKLAAAYIEYLNGSLYKREKSMHLVARRLVEVIQMNHARGIVGP